MQENTLGRVKFLVNLMFSRLDKFDKPFFCVCVRIYGGLNFGMLIGLHVWGTYILEGLMYSKRIYRILRYLLDLFYFKHYQRMV